MTDVHYARQEPECRAPSYADEVKQKLHDIAQLARRLKADAIGCAGDWLHRKGRASFHEANDLLAIMSTWRRWGLDVVGILGNHDIAGHALDSLDTRASGGLVHSKILHLLDHSPWVKEDLGVTGTSYFNGNDSSDEARVRTYGAPRPHTVDVKGYATGVEVAVHVHFAHGALMLSGDFFEDHTKPGPLVQLLHDAGRLPDVIVCGHLHFPEGIKDVESPDGRVISLVRPGSTTRVSSDDLERQPQVVVIATNGTKRTIKLVPVGQKDPPRMTAAEAPGDPRTPEERETRISEFVRVLREEADAFSLTDWRHLIREVADRMGHGNDVIDIALAAVEKRQ